MSENKEILSALMQTLNDRKKSDPESSYVASLYAKGVDAILNYFNTTKDNFLNNFKEETSKVIKENSEKIIDSIINQ